MIFNLDLGEWMITLSDFFALSLLAFMFWIAFWLTLAMVILIITFVTKKKLKELKRDIKEKF